MTAKRFPSVGKLENVVSNMPLLRDALQRIVSDGGDIARYSVRFQEAVGIAYSSRYFYRYSEEIDMYRTEAARIACSLFKDVELWKFCTTMQTVKGHHVAEHANTTGEALSFADGADVLSALDHVAKVAATCRGVILNIRAILSPVYLWLHGKQLAALGLLDRAWFMRGSRPVPIVPTNRLAGALYDSGVERDTYNRASFAAAWSVGTFHRIMKEGGSGRVAVLTDIAAPDVSTSCMHALFIEFMKRDKPPMRIITALRAKWASRGFVNPAFDAMVRYWTRATVIGMKHMVRTSAPEQHESKKAHKAVTKRSTKKRAVLSATRIAQYGDHAAFRRVVKYL
jgi:hypothetical protein